MKTATTSKRGGTEERVNPSSGGGGGEIDGRGRVAAAMLNPPESPVFVAVQVVQPVEREPHRAGPFRESTSISLLCTVHSFNQRPARPQHSMMMTTVTRRRSATGRMVSLLFLSCVVALATAFRSHQDTMLSDVYLRGIMNHLGDKMLADAPEGYLDYPLPSYEDMMMGPSVTSETESEMKEYEEAPESLNEPRERLGLGLSLRDQEYLKHSSLFSRHQEDDQPSSGTPTGSVKVSTTSSSSGKTENVLPAYCNPPNPCPIGYTAEDGCLEEFENTAAFSREYQAAQDCMCDTEHMFDCPASSLNHKTDKNRATANMVDTAIRKIMSDFQGEHKSLVSKKFFADKYYDELTGLKKRAHEAAEMAGADNQSTSENPYLQGDKLPIAAKKGNRVVA